MRQFRKEAMITYTFIFLMLFASFYFLYSSNGLTGLAIFNNENVSDFNQGNYINTFFNGTSIVLSGNNLTGSYESKVFDAGDNATWNNLSNVNNKPVVKLLFGVDRSGSVFKSTDSGVNWNELTSDYGRTTSTNDLISDNNYLYILTGTPKEVWRSSDGITWSVINDSFSSYSLLIGGVDSQGNIYAASGPGYVYKSTDSGVNWEFLSDVNPTTYDPKGLAIDSSDNIFIVDGTGSVFKSTDSGLSWIVVNDSYGGGSGTDDMKADSLDNLYILFNKQIYKSTDSGLSWIVVNDSFSPYSNNGAKMLIDSNDNLFILDLIGRVFKSTDYGVSWNEISDMNGVANNDPYGLVEFIGNTNVSIHVRNCSIADCSDGIWKNVDLNNINLNSRYFQYKVNFSRFDSSVSPDLNYVEINYDIINSAPVINLTSPYDRLYTYNISLNLNYSVFDVDNNLDSCWYNIDGGVNISLVNCENSSFNISQGYHNMTLFANDTNGAEVIDNTSFVVDSTGVSVSISEPYGEKTSRINIPINYIVEGNNIDLCFYNVETSIGGIVIENSSIENCSSTYFNVSIDGDYVINLYVNNSLGSVGYDSSSFSVLTASNDEGSSTTGSSGGGGGGSSGGGSISFISNIDFSKLKHQSINSGESKKISWNVKNSGLVFLNDCKVKGSGDFSSWISSNENIKLGGGETYDFIFSLKVPDDISSGNYDIGIGVECNEKSKYTNFSVDVLAKNINFSFTDLSRQNETSFKASYILEELSGINQNVTLQFLLYDNENNNVASYTQNVLLKANDKKTFSSFIPISDSLKGDFNLLVNIDSDIYSTFVQESIVLGSPLSGFSVFGNSSLSDNVLSVIVIIAFLVFSFFIVRRIIKIKKSSKK